MQSSRVDRTHDLVVRQKQRMGYKPSTAHRSGVGLCSNLARRYYATTRFEYALALVATAALWL